MLPDTSLICDLQSGATLCDAGLWHGVFITQTALIFTLALANVMSGIRHRLGVLTTPLWLARRFAVLTSLAALLPLLTGGLLAHNVSKASLACYLEHPLSGCTHNLLARAAEITAVWEWVFAAEVLLLSTSLVGALLLMDDKAA